MHNNEQNSRLLTPALMVAVSVLAASALLAGGRVLEAKLVAQTQQAEIKGQNVLGCFAAAKGTRVASGVNNDENWQLSQVDLNYEIIAKCLQEIEQQ